LEPVYGTIDHEGATTGIFFVFRDTTELLSASTSLKTNKRLYVSTPYFTEIGKQLV
jgi:hypothetical protein